MKTIAYGPKMEILTALMILFLSFIILTTVRAEGNRDSSKVTKNETVSRDKNTFMPDVKQSDNNYTSDDFLAKKIKSWITEGSYWGSDTNDKSESKPEGKLAYKMKRWMSDGTYWSLAEDNKNHIAEHALSER